MKSVFFNNHVDFWNDDNHFLTLGPKLDKELANINIKEDDYIVDLGCGTGILLKELIKRLNKDGKIYAVDFADKMLEKAQNRNADKRIHFIIQSAEDFIAPHLVDKVFCFSCWPHFNDKIQVLKNINKYLKPNGELYIWHLSSRKEINDIHQNADEIIKNDLFEDPTLLKNMLNQYGFKILNFIDNKEKYMINAKKMPEN